MPGSRVHVPLNDLVAAWAPAALDTDRAAVEALRSGQHLHGPETKRFEEEWAAYDGLPHGVGLSSGTEALRLSLMALRAAHPARDEVITVANSAPATAAAVWLAGLTPVFVDVNPQTGLMDVALALRAVTRRTLACLPVHLYGNRVNLDPLAEGLARRRVPGLVEDCAHAHGLSFRPTAADGRLARVRAWSFYPTKILAAAGDAGAVTTTSRGLALLVRSLANQHLNPRTMAPYMPCGHSRLAEVQAAVLRARLPHLYRAVIDRQGLVRRYHQRLPRGAWVLTQPEGSGHLMVALVRHRGQLRQNLAAAGVQTGCHYPAPAHRWPCARRLPHRVPAPLRQTEFLCRRVVSLPLYPNMGLERVDRVVRALRRAAGVEAAA